MRIYIFRILTIIHFLSSLSPFARKQRDRMGQRADLTKGSLVDGHHPRRNARLSNAPPGPGNNRRKFVKGGTHACARGGLFISAAGELAATALSLSDVTNVAFNATSQVSYYYSPWQPSQPFHPQPRPIGTKRPFDRVHMASRPQRAFLPLSLSLSRSLFLCPVSSQICGHVGLFIQWTEERSAGFGYCFSGCREREKKKEERVPG